MRDKKMIAGLLRERAGYVQRGDDDRVAQVDEQLAHYGYEPDQPPTTGADGAPAGRSPEGDKLTADGAGGQTAAPADDTAAAGRPPAKKAAARKSTAKKSAAAPPATG